MSTLGQYTEYDEWLLRLAEAQRYKLRLNAKKGFLGDVPPAVLLSLLKKEIEELEDAVARGSMIEMILEAGDVANFALGIVIAAMKPTPAVVNMTAEEASVALPSAVAHQVHCSTCVAMVWPGVAKDCPIRGCSLRDTQV